MDATLERECSALGILFQQIIQDMKNGAPLWEDLISKATKLHTCLKTAILAISAYLEAFQKIADAATNARGATREIGTALTRICLRHKAVETRVKSFTSAIMDCLVLPLQERLEDWKKSLVYLDKEHTKEFKKARTELKKKSSDTLRLQKKKARKGLQQQPIYGTLPHVSSQSNASSAIDIELGRMLESSAAVMQEKRQTLEETERKAVRAALLEERGRFCQFAKFLKPVLDEEMAMLMELTHLEEVAEQLEKHVACPQQLPPASEQVISDVKGREPGQWSLATPPSSPSLSLGSRKSSVCSISSLTSSSSGSCKSHPSPSAGYPSSAWQRSASQQPFNSMLTLRYRRSISSGSRDSGFTSLQEALYSQPVYRKQVSCPLAQNERNPKAAATSTWPDLQQETARLQLESQDPNAANERPHTISSAYEKGHQRPALSVYTFQAPESEISCHSQPASPVSNSSNAQQAAGKLQQQRKNSNGSIGRERPPIPNRCSSLERPTVPAKVDTSDLARNQQQSPRTKVKLPIPAHLAKELATQQPLLFQQPMYVNMHELASLAASRAQEMLPPPPPPPDNSSVGDSTMAPNATREKQEGKSAGSSGNCQASAAVQRRSSLQPTLKPSPPTRRASSVVGENNIGGERSEDLENLPPPPAFLLEGSSPPSSVGSPASQRRSISVSETVRTLTELRHTPASPSLLRRKACQSQITVVVDEKIPSRPGNPGTDSNVGGAGASSQGTDVQQRSQQQQQSHAPGGIAQSFMAALSAKLTGTTTFGSSTSGSGNESSASNSPRPVRKLSSEQHHQQHQSNRNSKTSSEFLSTLNARLAQQQQQQQVHHPQQQQQQQNQHQHQHQQQHHHQQHPHQHQQHHHQQHHHQQNQRLAGQVSLSIKSASVRRVMASRVPIIDPLQVRVSLMDQIRRGTSLRKTTGPINDRSAPKIY